MCFKCHDADKKGFQEIKYTGIQYLYWILESAKIKPGFLKMRENIFKSIVQKHIDSCSKYLDHKKSFLVEVILLGFFSASVNLFSFLFYLTLWWTFSVEDLKGALRNRNRME